MRQPPTQSPPHAPSESLVGQIIDGRYELFEFIAVNDVGTVFRAWDHVLQRIVAVKVLDSRIAAHPEMVASLRRQAEAAANLPTDRTIVTTYGAGVDGDNAYVVTELIRGPNLKAILKREAPFDLDRTLEIGQQIAEALDFAHQHGIVHGDLRPEHILISRQGRVKVAGFDVPSPGEVGAVTGADLSLRTAQYISPEQAQGRAATAASDIYTLGIMLFEMLTGSVPFTAGDARALAMKQVREQPAAPHRVNPEVAPEVSQAILRALNKDPKARFNSAYDLVSTMQPQTAPPQQTESVPLLQIAPVLHHTPKYLPMPTVTKPPAVPVRKTGGAWPALGRTLPYLLTIAIAGLGGWYVYHAVYRALNGGQKVAPVVHHTKHHTSRAGSNKAAGSHPQRAKQPAASSHRAAASPAAYSAPLVATPGCSGHNKGPVTLHYIQADQIGVAPGGTVTLNYTLKNPANVCRDTFLGATLISRTRPGFQFSDGSGDVIVQAQPGTHVYQRRLTFPPAAAGQSFDAVFSASGPLRAHTYSEVRLRHFFHVTG